MQYLHYIHINKNWFYYFSESDYNKSFRPYEGSGRISDKLIWFAGEDITKSNAKKILQEKFPNYEPILNYPYHKSMRLSGCGNGSRPYKHTEEKDEYRKVRDFKNKNKFLDFMEE